MSNSNLLRHNLACSCKVGGEGGAVDICFVSNRAESVIVVNQIEFAEQEYFVVCCRGFFDMMRCGGLVVDNFCRHQARLFFGGKCGCNKFTVEIFANIAGLPCRSGSRVFFDKLGRNVALHVKQAVGEEKVFGIGFGKDRPTDGEHSEEIILLLDHFARTEFVSFALIDAFDADIIRAFIGKRQIVCSIICKRGDVSGQFGAQRTVGYQFLREHSELYKVFLRSLNGIFRIAARGQCQDGKRDDQNENK